MKNWCLSKRFKSKGGGGCPYNHALYLNKVSHFPLQSPNLQIWTFTFTSTIPQILFCFPKLVQNNVLNNSIAKFHFQNGEFEAEQLKYTAVSAIKYRTYQTMDLGH